jgi:hypothetical protein
MTTFNCRAQRFMNLPAIGDRPGLIASSGDDQLNMIS